METSQSVPELVEAAKANAKPHQDQIAAGAQPDDLRAATTAIEGLAVDIYTVFEARMQHHFKRGPFSRKLKALLIGAGQPDLAGKIYEYYLAINVLKHGTGVSHRELVKTKSRLLSAAVDDATGATNSLVDVITPDIFDALCDTILKAYHFLER